MKSKQGAAMIDAKCLDDGVVEYIKAMDIETHDAKKDKDGHIIFYNSNTHKYYRTELPWEHGVDEFIEFVDRETNSSEMDKAS